MSFAWEPFTKLFTCVDGLTQTFVRWCDVFQGIGKFHLFVKLSGESQGFG